MKSLLPILIVILVLLTGCALQKDIIYLEERVDSLEARNQKMQRELSSNLDELGKNRESSENTLRSKYASVNVEVENLGEEVRTIRGRVEEIEYLLKRKVTDYESSGSQQKERLDELSIATEKLDQRLAHVEQYLSMETKNGKAPAPAASPDSPPAATDTAEQIYRDARQAFDNGELDKARQLFQQLIQKHPRSGNADNAQFWIGESFYREKWYERAVLEYQTVIEKYPKGNKVPAAMLKQGMALLNIGEKSSARLVLQDLGKKYPQSPEAKIAAKKLKEF